MARKVAGSNRQANSRQRSWELQLYVAGDNIKGQNAIKEIKKICALYLYRNCTIEVIDLKKTPEMTFKEHIVALPMLVRSYPEPKKILVGDLGDEKKVLHSLEIDRFKP